MFRISPNLAICTYEQLPLEQHKKIEKKEKNIDKKSISLH
jgi:hypothetical protein